MKIKRFILLAFSGCCLALSGAACSGLEGDNSDFDFGDMTSDAPDNPYDGQGYDRLPNSVRLATYNTHRCEGWTQNSGTDRANYNNTAKVISLMGEWALQSATAEMESDTDRNVGGAESTDSGIDAVSKIQRTAGKKKIQERPLIDYLNCKNKTEVLQCLRSFVSINRSAVHQALPYYVLKELRLVDGMHTAKEYSVGLTLQFPDLPSLKSESAIRQAVGSLKTARHIIKDGKDQSALLIESDENRELFRTLTEEISGIIRTDEETDIAE